MKQCLSSVHISFINNSLINLDQREEKRHQNQQLKVIIAQEQSCAYFAPLAASFVSATCNTPAREHWSSVFVHWLKKPQKVLSCYMEMCFLGNQVILSKNGIVFLEVVFDFCRDADISVCLPLSAGQSN